MRKSNSERLVKLSAVWLALTHAFKSDPMVLEALKVLSPRERRVVCMRFGIGESSDHTLEEVGCTFEVTRERIRQIEVSALEKIWKKILTDQIDKTSERTHQKKISGAHRDTNGRFAETR